MTVGGSPTQLIERAKTEVATIARSSVESVQVVSVEAVDWSDSSLGCPKGGMMYAQVITPGYKIVLESDGRTYEFHSSLNPDGPLVRCAGETSLQPTTKEAAIRRPPFLSAIIVPSLPGRAAETNSDGAG